MDSLLQTLLIESAKTSAIDNMVTFSLFFEYGMLSVNKISERKDRSTRFEAGSDITAWLAMALTDFAPCSFINSAAFVIVPVDHLYASAIFSEYIKTLDKTNLVIATPDVGGTKRVSSYAKYFGVPMVICYKLRKKANEVAEMQIIGDVKGMDVLLVDDIVDTAGTITKAAELMKEQGAKSVRAIASHAVMSDPASNRVDLSFLSEILFTDSIPYSKKSEKVTILSIADVFADSIRRVCNNESISSLYVL